MRFVFKKRFKFEEYPEILKCRQEYNDILNYAYSLESLREAGKCSNIDIENALNACDEYKENKYARVVFDEFYGKGLLIKDWRTKKIVKFDEQFKTPFNTINNINRQIIVSLVHIKFGWKLPAKYYTNKPFPVD